MRAELVMVGTELLLGQIIDTNATFLAQRLAEIGIVVYHKSVVGDNWLRMATTLSIALSRADIVITSGGLGPTMDDLTKDVIAAITGCPLTLHEEAWEHVQAAFARMGRSMPESNRRQALFPKGARMLNNPWGTAPGLVLEHGEKVIICLPGVPNEFEEMVRNEVIPYLRKRQQENEQVFVSQTLRFFGVGESELELMVHDIIAQQTNPTVAPYASLGEVRLRVTAAAPSEEAAQRLIAPVTAALLKRAGQYCFGKDEQSLEIVVAELLQARQWRLAVAESCTGGWLGQRLTSVPGSSAFFTGGFITYSNEAKRDWLGVPEDMLAQHGAVSEAVAQAMAEGARTRSGADCGVSITGVAGPGGGSAEKPVGLVYIGVASPLGVFAKRHLFRGNRDHIRQRSVTAALGMLWELLRHAPSGQ